MSGNRNKIGTCKCVDYFKDKNNNSYVRQVRRHSGEIQEIKCNRKVEDGKDFCRKHRNCDKFLKKFTNKEEPKYDPSKWEQPYIEGSHNCYAYFLDTIYKDLVKKCSKLCKQNSSNCPQKVKQCRSLIPQPGDYNLMNVEGNLKKIKIINIPVKKWKKKYLVIILKLEKVNLLKNALKILIKERWLLILVILSIFIDKIEMEHGVINQVLYQLQILMPIN